MPSDPLDLAPRLLALPADVRAALARVEGPGFDVHPVRGSALVCSHVSLSASVAAWWPANPAAAVAAVLDCTLAAACEHLLGWPNEHEDIEHPNAPGLLDDAALTLIEAHVASRSPHAS